VQIDTNRAPRACAARTASSTAAETVASTSSYPGMISVSARLSPSRPAGVLTSTRNQEATQTDLRRRRSGGNAGRDRRSPPPIPSSSGITPGSASTATRWGCLDIWPDHSGDGPPGHCLHERDVRMFETHERNPRAPHGGACRCEPRNRGSSVSADRRPQHPQLPVRPLAGRP